MHFGQCGPRGWELASGRWFQVCLDEASAPYLFLPGKGAQWASTSAELLATLVALVAFGWTAEARSRKSLELHLVAGTDNRANEFLSRKRATTKFPLMLINMQLSSLHFVSCTGCGSFEVAPKGGEHHSRRYN